MIHKTDIIFDITKERYNNSIIKDSDETQYFTM